MTNSNILEVKFRKPRFEIGQKVFLPEIKGVSNTEITGYVSFIRQNSSREFFGGFKAYHVNPYGLERIGKRVIISDELTGSNFYTNEDKAKFASRFLEVDVEEETWNLAIGKRNLKDKNSPFSLENCNLPPCCADISEVRDILYLCKKQKGLIVHDRDELYRLLFESHGFDYDEGVPIDDILRKLEIEKGLKQSQ